jgi:serine/threonine protein kinase
MGASAGVPQDALLGRIINERYEIVSFVARGGMGQVYRARQLPLGRPCAIKLMIPQLDVQGAIDYRLRFLLEASTAAKLTHPNTVRVFDYGPAGEGYYIAMEFLEGRSLREALAAEAPLSVPVATSIAVHVASALREAHDLGCVHQDLKPENVFLQKGAGGEEIVKVLDFGLVRDVTAPATAEAQDFPMGSPKYMAPEQITGDDVDARADVYALGVLLFEMVTGRVPFDGGDLIATFTAHMTERAPSVREVRPELAAYAGLDAAIARCLAKSPDERFSSMTELIAALGGADRS